MRRAIETGWFLVLTGLNALVWRLVPCEWSHPYQDLKGMEMENRYCWNPDHGEPCLLPCKGCQAECERADWEDSAVNRIRTREWILRQRMAEDKGDSERAETP